MGSIVKLVTAAIVAFTALGAHAQSPREQLRQLVERAQKNPGDSALRERILVLAREVKPPPVIPAEAERFEGRGKFAYKRANSPREALEAATEIEKAAALAPWVPGYYRDLCTIYEKAEEFSKAKRNCELYLVAAPGAEDAAEVRQLIAGLEFGIEKANSPERRAERQKAEKEAFLRSLDGARFVSETNGPDFAWETIYEVRGAVLVQTLRVVRVCRGCEMDGLSRPGQTREKERFRWQDGEFVRDVPEALMRQTAIPTADGQTLVLRSYNKSKRQFEDWAEIRAARR